MRHEAKAKLNERARSAKAKALVKNEVQARLGCCSSDGPSWIAALCRSRAHRPGISRGLADPRILDDPTGHRCRDARYCADLEMAETSLTT